jgi:hypothetical protein
MQLKLLWVVPAMLAVFGTVREASADIFQATFTGTYAGGVFGFFEHNGQLVTYTSIIGDPFTATFRFDSALGTLSSPSPGVEQLSGGNFVSPSSRRPRLHGSSRRLADSRGHNLLLRRPTLYIQFRSDKFRDKYDRLGHVQFRYVGRDRNLLFVGWEHH